MSGSSPQMTTSTTSSVPWNSGNLSEIQNSAVDLMHNDPLQYYPNQTYAQPSPYQTSGYSGAGNTFLQSGNQVGAMLPGAQTGAINQNNQIVGGSAISDAMPWFNMLGAMGGSNPAASQSGALTDLAQNGQAVHDLGLTSSGAFLNSNPYLDSMFGSAADAVQRAYQTSTAPQTDSAMNAAGRFGSGALAGARDVNQQGLGESLDKLASNIYGTNYQNERTNMVNAAGTMGGLQNSMLGNAGQLGVQGNNSMIAAINAALGGYNDATKTQLAAIQGTPTLTNMANSDYQAAINAGAGQQQLDQAGLNDLINRYYGTQQAPWSTLQQAANIVGGPIAGQTTSQTPYFTPSPFSQILGGATQGAGLAKAVFK